MQDPKNSQSDAPHSDATSKETLEDLEQSEQVSDSENPEHDSGPSPDGQLDEADEIQDAGPV